MLDLSRCISCHSRENPAWIVWNTRIKSLTKVVKEQPCLKVPNSVLNPCQSCPLSNFDQCHLQPQADELHDGKMAVGRSSLTASQYWAHSKQKSQVRSVLSSLTNLTESSLPGTVIWSLPGTLVQIRPFFQEQSQEQERWDLQLDISSTKTMGYVLFPHNKTTRKT